MPSAADEKYSIVDPEAFYTDFPKLTDRNHTLTSPATPRQDEEFPFRSYNCFAFVVGDTEKCWWPDGFSYWPNTEFEDTVEELMKLLKQDYGYEECADEAYEEGVEKVAIFVSNGAPRHVAIQPASSRGTWKSKIGFNVDIEHELRAIESKLYGRVERFMRRRRDVSPNTPARAK